MPAVIEGIIIHRCESGRTGDEVRQAEAKDGLGYHYFVESSGDVAQLYSDSELIFHACKWSHMALGIAVFGDFHPIDRSRYSIPTAGQRLALVALCKSLVAKYGPLFIMGHTDLTESTKIPGKVCPGVNLDVRALSRAVYSRGQTPMLA